MMGWTGASVLVGILVFLPWHIDAGCAMSAVGGWSIPSFFKAGRDWEKPHFLHFQAVQHRCCLLL